MPEITCARTGCERAATHHLVARVWAVGYPKTSPPITATIGLPLCRDHAEAEAKSQDVIGAEFWDLLQTLTRARGLVAPDRSSLELRAVRGQSLDQTMANYRRGKLH